MKWILTVKSKTTFIINAKIAYAFPSIKFPLVTSVFGKKYEPCCTEYIPYKTIGEKPININKKAGIIFLWYNKIKNAEHKINILS